ncbi:MAG: dihydrofolate reductase [Opitutales bacterium]
MNAQPLSLIVACAENRVIGREGRLPFRLPEDRAWFEQHTAGRTLVLGRISYTAWSGARHDGRRPVVVTSQAGALPPPARTAPTVATALALARSLAGEIMVCGGQRIFEETLPLADRLYLTLVHAEATGDRWFPEWRNLAWRESYRRDSEAGGVRYTFQILERVRTPAAALDGPARTST